MPYEIKRNHPSCPLSEPFGVVKEGTSKPLGCHKTRTGADKQIAALYASEKDKK